MFLQSLPCCHILLTRICLREIWDLQRAICSVPYSPQMLYFSDKMATFVKRLIGELKYWFISVSFPKLRNVKRLLAFTRIINVRDPWLEYRSKWNCNLQATGKWWEFWHSIHTVDFCPFLNRFSETHKFHKFAGKFVAARCRYSLVAVIHVQYECNTTNLIDNLTRAEISSTIMFRMEPWQTPGQGRVTLRDWTFVWCDDLEPVVVYRSVIMGHLWFI